jgi:hypothetical protein
LQTPPDEGAGGGDEQEKQQQPLILVATDVGDLAARDERQRKIGELLKEMDGDPLGGPYTREEMNRM